MERLSGLEFMQKIAQGNCPNLRWDKPWVKVVEAELGKTVFEGQLNASTTTQSAVYMEDLHSLFSIPRWHVRFIPNLMWECSTPPWK